MIDQKQSNNISKFFGCAFIVLGFAMLCIGIPFFTIADKNETENTIMVLAILSGLLLLLAGYQTIKRSRQKDKAIDWYQDEIETQLKNKATQSKAIEKNIQTEITRDSDQSKAEIQTNLKSGTEFKPDIIAQWTYSKKEWKFMNREEVRRRLKEGVWVSLGIALLGGWILSSSRGTTFVFGFFFSLAIGIFVSLLKVFVLGNLLSRRESNSIIITTNAIIINGKFKTIQDDHLNLEYVKALEHEGKKFIEFSLQWPTRGGVTNDQFRVFVPHRYEKEIPGVVAYYGWRGAKNS